MGLVVIWFVILLLLAFVAGVCTAKLGPYFMAQNQPYRLDQLQSHTYIPVKTTTQPDTPRPQFRAMLQKFLDTKDADPPVFVVGGHLYEIQKGIHVKGSSTKVVVYSGGWRQFGSANSYGAYLSVLGTGVALGRHMVVFDYPADYWGQYRHFNFCQDVDIKCLDTIVEEVVNQQRNENDERKIFLYAPSKGALSAMNWLAYLHQHRDFPRCQSMLQQIGACAIVCPVLSFSKAVGRFGKVGPAFYWLATHVMPNFRDDRTHGSTTQASLLSGQRLRLPTELRYFFSSLPNDLLSYQEDVDELVEYHRTTSGCNIQYYRSKHMGLVHGRIAYDQSHTEMLHSWLTKDPTYDPEEQTRSLNTGEPEPLKLTPFGHKFRRWVSIDRYPDKILIQVKGK